MLQQRRYLQSENTYQASKAARRENTEYTQIWIHEMVQGLSKNIDDAFDLKEWKKMIVFLRQILYE